MREDAYQLDKARVRAFFDRAAPGYDAAALLQQEVRQRMLARLDLIKIAPSRILDVGAGTGHAARALAARYQGSEVFMLDIALAMLRQSQRSQPWWRKFAGRQQQAICADMEALPLAAASMDFAWSNLALQWSNDLDRALGEMARVLRPEGLLMFSTFGPDTLKELREATKADAAHAHVSRFIDMHDIGDALVRAGFSTPVLDVERFVLTYEDVLGVMRDLKAIGARNATQGRRRGLQGRGFLGDLTERYEQFRSAGKLPATYEVVYGHAWRGKPSQAASGEQVIRIYPRT